MPFVRAHGSKGRIRVRSRLDKWNDSVVTLHSRLREVYREPSSLGSTFEANTNVHTLLALMFHLPGIDVPHERETAIVCKAHNGRFSFFRHGLIREVIIMVVVSKEE